MAATTLTDRALVRLSGEGVRDFLQGLGDQRPQWPTAASGRGC